MASLKVLTFHWTDFIHMVTLRSQGIVCGICGEVVGHKLMDPDGVLYCSLRWIITFCKSVTSRWSGMVMKPQQVITDSVIIKSTQGNKFIHAYYILNIYYQILQSFLVLFLQANFWLNWALNMLNITKKYNTFLHDYIFSPLTVLTWEVCRLWDYITSVPVRIIKKQCVLDSLKVTLAAFFFFFCPSHVGPLLWIYMFH